MTNFKSPLQIARQATSNAAYQSRYEDADTNVSNGSNQKTRTRYLAGRMIAIRGRQASEHSGAHSKSQSHRPFVFNADVDSVYANPSSLPSNEILTMFCQQWVGIRQACGALSGPKLAIDAHHDFTSREVELIVDTLRNLGIRIIMHHGFAPSTAHLLRSVKKLAPDLTLLGVWHGTMAGWTSDAEISLYRAFAELADEKVFSQIAFLRQGMQSLHPRAFKSIIYNIPPLFHSERRKSGRGVPMTCIFPSWNNHWKNMCTNLLAAERADSVKDVIVYSLPQLDIFRKARLIEFGTHELHFRRLESADLCLSVSINDCQPMAELEALSVGTPSLRADWNLGLEPKSEYEQVFTIQSPLNAAEISERIQHISTLDCRYTSEIIDNHKKAIKLASLHSYTRFSE